MKIEYLGTHFSFESIVEDAICQDTLIIEYKNKR